MELEWRQLPTVGYQTWRANGVYDWRIDKDDEEETERYHIYRGDRWLRDRHKTSLEAAKIYCQTMDNAAKPLKIEDFKVIGCSSDTPLWENDGVFIGLSVPLKGFGQRALDTKDGWITSIYPTFQLAVDEVNKRRGVITCQS